DAVARTLARLYVTRRNLLEWETASATERRLGTGFLHFCVTMWMAPVLAALLALLVGYARPDALPAAGLFLAAWLLSPAPAYWVRLPRAEAEPPLTPQERQELRRVARKTWGFFEAFVGEEDHGLPPDNFQEDPKGQVAHRTSPTNVGLCQLSSLAAHDLGYLSRPALTDRLEKTFDTLDRLERFRGHFYNWYDTRTLQVLQPAYVSTVDSGNLLGCLVALKQGLREKADAALGGPEVREGLADTLGLVAESLRPLLHPGNEEPGPLRLLASTVSELDRVLQESTGDRVGWDHWRERVEHRADELVKQGRDLARRVGEAPEELRRWIQCFADQVRDRRDEFRGLAP